MSIQDIMPAGEDYTEFERGDGKGPFNCHNCLHMDHKGGVCNHPVMILSSNQPRKNGKPEVDRNDCCKYIRRPEKS